MKQVTRNTDPSRARDLLERIPRACLCFACDRGPQAKPVVVVWRDDRYLVGMALDADEHPGPGQVVVLLIDEGGRFFDLRAIYIRGQVKPTEAPMDGPINCMWFEVVLLKTVAWDYGTLREVRDGQ